jgi:hypothetical protein
MPKSPIRPRLPEVLLPHAAFEQTDHVWREIADEVWTTMKNTERLVFTKIFEQSFVQQVNQTPIHHYIATC